MKATCVAILCREESGPTTICCMRQHRTAKLPEGFNQHSSIATVTTNHYGGIAVRRWPSLLVHAQLNEVSDI